MGLAAFWTAGAAALAIWSTATPAVAGEAAWAPFPADVRRGPEGTYSLIGREWTYDARAYTVRYRDHLARLSLFAMEPVTGRRLRIRQPAGAGPPFAGFSQVLRIAELEIYEREDPTRYTRVAGDNLTAGDGVTLSASDSLTTLERVRDGVLVCPVNAPFWSTAAAERDHALELTFPRETTWNQIVIYWPVEEMAAEAFADVPLLEGRRPERLVIEVERGSGWVEVAAREIRPDALHDGAFIREALDLPFPVSDRLDHAERFERWHTMRPRDPSARPSRGDTEVTVGWSILLEEGADPLARLGADELHTFFEDVMGTRVPVVACTAAELTSRPGPAIVFLPADPPTPDDPEDTHAIEVRPGRIVLRGVGARGVRFAALRLEERMTRRRAPLIDSGEEVRRPVFSPRIAAAFAFGAGSDGLGFPDWYLAMMSRHYLSGIYIFQSTPFMNDAFSVVGSPIDESLVGDPEKRDLLRDLVVRARRHGLGVYWCIAVPGALPGAFYERHPEVSAENRGPNVVCLSTPLGRQLVSDSIGRLVREVPGLSGLVVLRTELNHSCGGRLNCPRCKTVAPGRYDPMQRVFGWVREAAAAVDSSLAVIAFDWRAGNLPPISARFLPADIAYWVRPDTVQGGSPENHLAAVGVNAHLFNAVHTYTPERKLWLELQTTHGFPFHGQPELPIAPRMVTRMETLRRVLRERAPEAPLPGIAIGNGSGLWPYPVTSLTTRELMWDTAPRVAAPVTALAADWYGDAQASDAEAIWEAYAKIIAQARLPKYVSRAAVRLAPWEVELDELVPVPPSRLVDALARQWTETFAVHEAIVRTVPADRRPLAEQDLTFAAGQRHTLWSLARTLTWMERFGVAMLPDSLLARGDSVEIAAARALVDAELSTTNATIRLFATESTFRFHPYYRNSFGLPVLVKKRRALEAARLTLGSGVAP